jgi:hypothetical protein
MTDTGTDPIQIAKLDGVVDAALPHSAREALIAAVRRDALEAGDDAAEDDRLRIAATSLSVHTMLFDHAGAIASLGRFQASVLSPQVARRADPARAADLVLGFAGDVEPFAKLRGSPIAKGRLASQVGNACYRLGDFREGEKWVDFAERCFDRSEQDRLEVVLARAENAVWRVRIMMRRKRSDALMHELRDSAIEPLYRHYGERGDLAEHTGVSHRLGIALDLAGALYSVRGEGDAALRCLFEALYQLSSPGVRDTVRLAHAQLATAEALLNHRHGNARLACVLSRRARDALSGRDPDAERGDERSGADRTPPSDGPKAGSSDRPKGAASEARAYFAKHAHPLLVRAQVTMAQAHMECAGSFRGYDPRSLLDEADAQLGWLKGLLEGEQKDNRMLRREHRFASAQRAVISTRMHARDGKWRAALEEAERIRIQESESSAGGFDAVRDRFEAERSFQMGRAMTRIGDFNEGLRLIDQAINIARAEDRIKLRIAGILARAEALFMAEERQCGLREDEARAELEKARAMCESVESDFLRKWLVKLSSRAQRAPNVNLDLPYKDAVIEFQKHYLHHHLDQAEGRIDDAAKKTKLSASKFYRLRAKLDVGRAPRGGKRHG